MTNSREGDKENLGFIAKEKIKAHALDNALQHEGKATQGPVLNALFAEGLKKENIKDIIPQILSALEEVNSLSPEQQQKEFEKLSGTIKKREIREGLPELPNVKEKVVMRFAPFPSGPLHIGNTRQLVLNDEYVKNHKGKFILVIDDTIGSAEKPIMPEAYDLIKQGVKWMQAKPAKVVLKSERLEKYYSFAEELIKKGYMYVCDCKQESFRELRVKGIECPCRHLPEHKQMERWKKMFSQESKDGDLVVRLKTSMQHPNPAFRDRVMFRISTREHPLTKKKYKVWPLLEFSWAIDDHLLGITHIIRGVDLMMETEIEKFIWDIFRWEHPETIHTGFFAIEGIKLSKSKGSREVKSGEYIGWNDPRTWSLQSLKDRGIKAEAIREFILNMGITKANSTVAIDSLYALNRKHLEDAPRYFFVPEPVKIHISGCPEIDAKIPLNPKDQKNSRNLETNQDFLIPQQDYELMQNANYRLIHLLNFRSDNVLKLKPRTFSFISQDPEQDLDVKFIQWLPANEENLKVKVRMPDNSSIHGLGEPSLKSLKEGTIVQFERFGFCKLHKKSKEGLEFWFAHH